MAETTAGFIVLSGKNQDIPTEVEFVHTNRSVADAERRKLSRWDRSRRFVTRPATLRVVSYGQ